jgi:hypothetical protein
VVASALPSPRPAPNRPATSGRENAHGRGALAVGALLSSATVSESRVYTPVNARCWEMKTVNLFARCRWSRRYFFSLVAAAVNLTSMEIRPKSQETAKLAPLAQLRRQTAANTGSGF